MADIYWVKLKIDTFTDEKIRLIEALPSGHTYIVLFFKLLCIAGKQNMCGLISLDGKKGYTDEMLSILLNSPTDVIYDALEVLKNFGIIEIDDSGIITIVNFEKHQNAEGMERARELKRARMARYRQRQAERKRLTSESSVTSTVTSQVTISDAVELETELKKDIKYLAESEELRLTMLLYNLLKERNPKHKKPNLQKWAHHIHLLMNKDKRTVEEIQGVILFSQSDSFWKNNILSTEKLREKFDALYLKMNADKNKPQKNNDENNWDNRLI